MRKVLIAVGVVVAVFIGVFALNSGQKTEQAEKVSFANIESAMSDGSKLIDVREDYEFSEGHVLGATSLPLSQIQSSSIGDLDKNKTHYLYCRSGNRSAQATAILTAAGYNIVDLGSIGSVADLGGQICTNC